MQPLFSPRRHGVPARQRATSRRSLLTASAGLAGAGALALAVKQGSSVVAQTFPDVDRLNDLLALKHLAHASTATP